MKKLLSLIVGVGLIGSGLIMGVESVRAQEGGNPPPAYYTSQRDIDNKIKEIREVKADEEFNATTGQNALYALLLKVMDGTQVGALWAAGGGRPEYADDGTLTGYSPGIVGSSTQAIAWIMNTPAATTERYVADVLNSAGIAEPAYAQGLGFAALDPILGTWKIFRNMAYLFFIVIFLVLGFMIMLRQKIGGQAAVTAQQAIPNVIVSLLLVTFSYAIAGLMIDLMYLVMYLALALFGQSNLSGEYLDKNFLTLGWIMVKSGFSSSQQAVALFTENFTQNMSAFAQGTTDFLGGLTLAVVVSIAIALKVVQLFFELLKTYVTIILTIAFAPVFLAFGAIPGKNMFGQWIKDIVGNLAAFPTVLIVLLVFDQLTGGISENVPDVTGGGFQPPYLFGGGTSGLMPFLVGLGMLMIMPEIVQQAKKAMGVKEGILAQFARDAGESLKKGWSGGELVPGVGLSNTNKYGISGKEILSKPFFGTEEGRKRASQDGWKGRLSRAMGDRGAIGETYQRIIRVNKRKTQPEISEERNRDVTPPTPSSVESSPTSEPIDI